MTSFVLDNPASVDQFGDATPDSLARQAGPIGNEQAADRTTGGVWNPQIRKVLLSQVGIEDPWTHRFVTNHEDDPYRFEVETVILRDCVPAVEEKFR
jgi:hypothetical protein